MDYRLRVVGYKLRGIKGGLWACELGVMDYELWSICYRLVVTAMGYDYHTKREVHSIVSVARVIGSENGCLVMILRGCKGVGKMACQGSLYITPERMA